VHYHNHAFDYYNDEAFDYHNHTVDNYDHEAFYDHYHEAFDHDHPFDHNRADHDKPQGR